LAILISLATVVASADVLVPVFAPDFNQSCVLGAAASSADWRVSSDLHENLRPLRLRCTADAEAPDHRQVLRIEVAPGDAFDPNLGDKPTERVEIQARRQLVSFDTPVWYTFRFRLEAPWTNRVNRTVIHQIKQNIEASAELGRGGTCPSANPFFKIEAGADESHGGAVFVVKTRGTDNCHDGQAAVPICGPWPLSLDRWHRVHVMLEPSQVRSELHVWLDGRPCAAFTGRLGYLDHGKRDVEGRPIVDTQPRFGIYRDALPDVTQAIDFADIAFWSTDPTGDSAWRGIEPAAR
jgi:hypothetical protein